MLDRSTFLRPIAHRGLHDASRGVLENTGPAFAAAIAKGYSIECDLRPAADGTPMVFHDLKLARLIDADGLITDRTPGELAQLRYRGQDTPILTYAAFLAMVDGAVPLLVEIKSEWDAPRPGFLESIAAMSVAYRGPMALMSFDPAVMATVKGLAPRVPRGIVAGMYKGEGWWLDRLDETRAFQLSHLLESRAADPHFYAYHVKALPTPVTRYVREVLGLPLMTWTVRTPEDRAVAARWADAPIFEGFEA